MRYALRELLDKLGEILEERVKKPDPRAYVRLAALLRDQLAPGEPLPSIRELHAKARALQATGNLPLSEHLNRG